MRSDASLSMQLCDPKVLKRLLRSKFDFIKPGKGRLGKLCFGERLLARRDQSQRHSWLK